MKKTYRPEINMWALDTDEDHILHRTESADYPEIRHTTVRDPDGWEEIAVADIPPYTEAEYNAKVAELIHERYSADRETSLINNMLEVEPTEAHKTEYAEYQRFRAECKLRAKDASLYQREEEGRYDTAGISALGARRRQGAIGLSEAPRAGS